MLKISNTLTHKKEPFTPIKPPYVGVYVCGMTTYDLCHIGNGRVFVFFDTVVRYLRAIGYAVKYVRNITDIDDKIIRRAEELGVSWSDHAERFIAEMHVDMSALGTLDPDVEPRVTQHIPLIIDTIKTLLDKNYAYVANNGDVYFDINKFATYGEFAQQKPDEMRAGARVEINEFKRDPLDFVLWKCAKPNEPAWESPWGEGRPGWHIECSVMSQHYLGNTIDIHGGGADLQFPHHQNEIAQAEAACGCKFVNYWMHVGFVSLNHEKMSKSRGNFFTIREILKQYHPEVLRYFLLSSHYKSPINYTEDNLNMAQAALTRLYTAIRGLTDEAGNCGGGCGCCGHDCADVDPDLTKNLDKFLEQFQNALEDDFNIPLAMSFLFELSHYINKLRSDDKQSSATQACLVLREIMGGILGILQCDPEHFLQNGGRGSESVAPDETQIEALITKREVARNTKDWALADSLRKELLTLGVIVEDTPSGSTWKRA